MKKGLILVLVSLLLVLLFGCMALDELNPNLVPVKTSVTCADLKSSSSMLDEGLGEGIMENSCYNRCGGAELFVRYECVDNWITCFCKKPAEAPQSSEDKAQNSGEITEITPIAFIKTTEDINNPDVVYIEVAPNLLSDKKIACSFVSCNGHKDHTSYFLNNFLQVKCARGSQSGQNINNFYCNVKIDFADTNNVSPDGTIGPNIYGYFSNLVIASEQIKKGIVFSNEMSINDDIYRDNAYTENFMRVIAFSDTTLQDILTYADYYTLEELNAMKKERDLNLK